VIGDIVAGLDINEDEGGGDNPDDNDLKETTSVMQIYINNGTNSATCKGKGPTGICQYFTDGGVIIQPGERKKRNCRTCILNNDTNSATCKGRGSRGICQYFTDWVGT
jgi:hypothetical protein